MYPYKVEEFGKLILCENVIKAKLVSLNNYGATGPIMINPSKDNSSYMRHMHTESQMSGTFYLFTVEENDYLTLYKIKSYMQSLQSATISNFKMAKKTSLLLEYPVNTIEWINSEAQQKA